MRKWGIIIAAAVVIIFVGGLIAQQRGRSAAPARPSGSPQASPAEPDVAAVEATPAALGSIEQTLDLTGTVVSSRRVELTPKIPGKVAAIYVQEGARVSSGQAIASLDSSDLAAQVAQAEQGVRQAAAGREVAQARLAALISGARTQERAVAESAVVQAEANLNSAERNVVRMQQLFESGAVSRQQLDDAIHQRDVMKAALNSARQQLSLVETGARPEDLRMARAQVEQADAGYAAAVASLRLARVQLAYATIRAPFPGRIAELPATLGEFVAPGSKVAVLYDDRALEVEVTIGERDLRLVRPGQPVRVRAEAAAAIEIRGAVRLVQPAADPLTRAAKARIRLADPPGTLSPGTSVRAEILVERRENVLIIPSSALRQNGSTEVIVVKNGKAQVRRVLVGFRHHQSVQITYGVQVGELVVTLGPEDLSDGQAVKVVNR